MHPSARASACHAYTHPDRVGVHRAGGLDDEKDDLSALGEGVGIVPCVPGHVTDASGVVEGRLVRRAALPAAEGEVARALRGAAEGEVAPLYCVVGCFEIQTHTVYSASRTATTSFFTHHLRLISLAAVIGAALPVAIWAKATRKSHLLSGAPLAGLLPVVM